MTGPWSGSTPTAGSASSPGTPGTPPTTGPWPSSWGSWPWSVSGPSTSSTGGTGKRPPRGSMPPLPLPSGSNQPGEPPPPRTRRAMTSRHRWPSGTWPCPEGRTRRPSNTTTMRWNSPEPTICWSAGGMPWRRCASTRRPSTTTRQPTGSTPTTRMPSRGCGGSGMPSRPGMPFPPWMEPPSRSGGTPGAEADPLSKERPERAVRVERVERT